MTAPLPLGLRNPYRIAFDAMSPHDKHTSEGMCVEREAYAHEEGARAVIARLRADAFLLRRVGLQEPIQKLADEYERELKGET